VISEQFEIINTFSTGINIELTINQVSKITRKSYGFSNKYVHELINLGILTKKIVGPSLLCSLNLQNEETIGCLIYNSIKKRQEFMRNDADKHEKLNKIVKKISITENDIVLFAKDKVYLVYSSKEVDKTKYDGIIFIKIDSFKEEIKKIDLSVAIILQGHEAFWRLLSKVML
jgi:hypothetical protein